MGLRSGPRGGGVDLDEGKFRREQFADHFFAFDDEEAEFFAVFFFAQRAQALEPGLCKHGAGLRASRTEAILRRGCARRLNRARLRVVVTLRSLSRWLLAVFFVVAGANHFRAPEIYLGMMPPSLPWPGALNAIAGAAEILGGLGVLLSRTRRLAGWGLIALLVAVFPANLHVALAGRMPGTSFSPLTLWLRLPFQAGFIAWVWWVALARAEPRR